MPDNTEQPTPPPESEEGLPAHDEDEQPTVPVEVEQYVDPDVDSLPDPPIYQTASGPYVTSRSWATDPWREQSSPRTGRRGGFWKSALLAVVAALIGAGVATGVMLVFDDDTPANGGSPVTVIERISTEILSPEESGSRAAAVAQRVLPSIVTVEVRDSDVGTFVADGSGSGVVLSGDGLLITNHHVIEGAQQVRVIFADGRAYEAEVIGSDPLTDLAVLRIDAVGLTAVDIGSTETMQIGDTAIAIGSPLGLQGGPSVTAGVVSAFDRRVQTGIEDELFGMLQTDAPITRGSSGGALVDREGRLIGITTAIGVSDVGAEGLGFAIPVELVIRITDDLIEFGEARHAFLGVTGSTFFTETGDGATVPSGVAVASVLEGTAAELAGIEPGDVIMSVDGDKVTTMEQLVVGIRFYRVDDSVDVVLERSGDEQTISVILLERPEDV